MKINTIIFYEIILLFLMKINTINFYEIVTFPSTLTAIMFPVNLCIALK